MEQLHVAGRERFVVGRAPILSKNAARTRRELRVGGGATRLEFLATVASAWHRHTDLIEARMPVAMKTKLDRLDGGVAIVASRALCPPGGFE